MREGRGSKVGRVAVEKGRVGAVMWPGRSSNGQESLQTGQTGRETGC